MAKYGEKSERRNRLVVDFGFCVDCSGCFWCGRGKKYVEFDEENSTLNESRYDYTGMIDVGGMPVLYVVATENGEKTRIISARKATVKEVSKYEQNAKNL